jgi:hypothetical protein
MPEHVEDPVPHADNDALHEAPPETLMGRRVHIYMCKFRKWFPAVVGSKHVNNADYFQVLFEDNSKEWLLFGKHAASCVWALAAGDVALENAPFSKCPTLDHRDDQWHLKCCNDLVGATMYIQSLDKSSWNMALVIHCKRNATRVLVQYSDGTQRTISPDPGGDAWGLAPVHPALHAVLNRNGTKRLDQYQHGNRSDIIVSVSLNRDKRSLCTMTRYDMTCLAPGTWLNDSAIEICTSLLCNTADCRVVHQGFYRKLVQSTHIGAQHANPLYTTDLKKWFKDAGAMWLKDKILVVVNLQCCSNAKDPWQTAVGNHWVLATIDLKDKTFRYYDPMGVHQREELHNEQMSQCISNLTMWLKAEHPVELPWVSHHSGKAVRISSPQQGNAFDCGVFTILAAVCEALRIPLCTMPWGQQHAGTIRTQLAALMLK